MPFLVSIIMPLHNAEKYVAEAIKSVIAQTYIYWELIIVNDGSTDNSLTVAKQFESEKIKIFDQENQGASAARNFGYKQSKGTCIKFFDADDIINPLMLEEQVKLATQYPESIISAKWGRFFNDDITTFQLSPEECWQNMKPVDWICSSWHKGTSMTQPGIFLLPRNIITLTGLWNESLSLIDDLEFFTKTILASKGIIFSANSMLYYRSGISNALSGRKSRVAVQSCYQSIKLSIGYLLKASQENKAKLSAANVWQSFLYEIYPNHIDLVKKAENHIAVLIKPNLNYTQNKLYHFSIKIFGWKLFKKMQLLKTELL